MAVGEQFIDEAQTSVESVRREMPDVDVAIATDDRDYDLSDFDEVIELDQARQKVIDGRTWLIDSTIGPDLSPYDKTLYLDTDTYVCDDVSELFDLLDQYDLAVARTPDQPRVSDLPPPWHLYNCGVIAYRDSEDTQALLKDWQQRYRRNLKEQDQPEDQPAFARALHDSNIRWFTLPREYNVRFPRRGVLAHQAKLIHGRHRQGLEQVAKEINRSNNLRIFQERSYYSRPVLNLKDRGTARYIIEETIINEGISVSLKLITAWISDRIFGTNLYNRWFRYHINYK